MRGLFRIILLDIVGCSCMDGFIHRDMTKIKNNFSLKL